MPIETEIHIVSHKQAQIVDKLEYQRTIVKAFLSSIKLGHLLHVYNKVHSNCGDMSHFQNRLFLMQNTQK